MADNNITPAVNLQGEDNLTEMSASEFQQRLYGWFEDRGLLSELRAHLRKQMIGVLKDTAIGRTVSGQQKQISPKLQALNLLIAEFLLQQEYHYSLSVFSTEVPLISVLPEFPTLLMNCSTGKNEDARRWKFSEKDMWDILETLGVQQDTDEGKIIFNTYYNSIHREPLLTCIVRMLHSLKGKSQTNLLSESKGLENETLQNGTALGATSSDQWVKIVHDLLRANNVTAQSSNEIINLLKNVIKTEKKRFKEEAREEFLKLQMHLQSEAAKKEEEQRKKLALVQKSMDIEQEKRDSEKDNRVRKVNTFEHKLQKHRDILRDRYQTLHVRERDIAEREQQIGQRETALNAQQHRLQTGLEALYREQTAVSTLQNKLKREARENQKTAKSDAEFLRDLQEECKNMRNQICDTQEAVFNATSKTVVTNDQASSSVDGYDAERTLVKGLIRQLQLENSGLRTLNSEQQFRIDELSQRAALLMYDLENSQAANQSRSRILSAPPLVAPEVHISSRLRASSNSGAGEEGYRPTLPTSPTEYRHASIRDSRRRVPPRRLTIHSSSSSDDHSPTNEVLKEARERLRQLEEESEEVDRHYRQFRSRQAHTDRQFYPRHFQPSAAHAANNDLQNFNFNPEVFTKYLGNSSEASGSRSLRQENQMNGRRNMSNLGDEETPCCSNFPSNRKKKIDLSELVEWHFNETISCMINDRSLSDFSDNQQIRNNAVDSEKKDMEEKEEERQFDSQSLASSGILHEMLAAATSGISLSDIDAADENSKSVVQHQND